MSSAAPGLDEFAELERVLARPLASVVRLRPWQSVARELAAPARTAPPAMPARHALLRALRAQGVVLAFVGQGALRVSAEGEALHELVAENAEALKEALWDEALEQAPPYWCPAHGTKRQPHCFVCGVQA